VSFGDINWEGLICRIFGHKETINTVDSEGPWYVYCSRCYIWLGEVDDAE
jgi:hypothetical protein